MLLVVTFETVITVQKKYNLVSNSYLNSINFACVGNLNSILNYIKNRKRYKYKATPDAVIQFDVNHLFFCLFFNFLSRKDPPMSNN